MQNIITTLIQESLEHLKREGASSSKSYTGKTSFRVERPRDKKHGDFSVNVALVLARDFRMKPRDLAARIIDALPKEKETVVERCEIAGPGFINFLIRPDRWRQLVHEIRHAGTAYGRSRSGTGQRVLIEFVSANPTGPLHVGHGRGAVVGDAMARILEATGFSVEREYYINDAGFQVTALGQSVLIRYRSLFGGSGEIPSHGYPGAYVLEIAEALKQRDGDQWLETSEDWQHPPDAVVEFAMNRMVETIRNDLDVARIRFDHWFSERSLHTSGAIEKAIDRLERGGFVYEGALEPPKGKQLEGWEARRQQLFKATQFGDEVDRPLRKEDGSATYFAADMAYHLDKVQRGFTRLINIWGADHGGYVTRVQAALKALTDRENILYVKLVQMVNLSRDGRPVRMSKRAGTFVTFRDLLDEVGADVVRFWFLLRSGDAHLEMDLKTATAQSNDNPVFYVQYAHARICSVWRKLTEQGRMITEQDLDEADLSLLNEPEALDLIRCLDLFPEVVEGAAMTHEPHRIPHYLHDLAALFHAYYNGCKILEKDFERMKSRLALIAAVKQVLVNGLTLIGVSAPERM